MHLTVKQDFKVLYAYGFSLEYEIFGSYEYTKSSEVYATYRILKLHGAFLSMDDTPG